MNDPFATQKDTTFRQPNASEVEDFKAMTGWDTPAEMAAYEKGREHEQAMLMKFIKEWNGETNSTLGWLLADKFKDNEVRQINHDDMQDLRGEDISRFATPDKVLNSSNQTHQ